MPYQFNLIVDSLIRFKRDSDHVIVSKIFCVDSVFGTIPSRISSVQESVLDEVPSGISISLAKKGYGSGISTLSGRTCVGVSDIKLQFLRLRVSSWVYELCCSLV